MAACQTTPYIVGATIGRPQKTNGEGQTKREAKRLPYKRDFIQRRRAGACSRRNERLESKKAAGCKHTPLRSVASLLRKHCPRPTNVTFDSMHTRDNLFPINSPIHISVATYFPSSNRTTNLTAHTWKYIFHQQTYPTPEGNLNFPSANLTVPYPHICGNQISVSRPIRP